MLYVALFNLMLAKWCSVFRLQIALVWFSVTLWLQEKQWPFGSQSLRQFYQLFAFRLESVALCVEGAIPTNVWWYLITLYFPCGINSFAWWAMRSSPPVVINCVDRLKLPWPIVLWRSQHWWCHKSHWMWGGGGPPYLVFIIFSSRRWWYA